MTSKEEEDLVKVAPVIFIVLGLLFFWGAFGLESIVFGIMGIVCIAIGWVILHHRRLERTQEIERSKQNRLNRMAREEEQLAILPNRIEEHRHALRRNLDRALIINDYGAITQDNRNEVIKEFMGSVGLDCNLIGSWRAREIIFEQLAVWEERDRESGFDPATIPTDGHEFEHWVAENLNQFGWDAKATSGSGDQGIDVIATKDGKTVGLQCKLFSSPVGNKAVQEAHAGKAFHQMDVVGVISNASYTKSAKALATDTGVKLLSHHDIPNLYEKMFSE